MQAPHERIHVLDLPPLGDALTEEATFVESTLRREPDFLRDNLRHLLC
jgi:hypothetical protein